MDIVVIVIFFSSVIGYLVGSVNTSIIVGKLLYKVDIREHGSGNAGATNTLRTLGKSAAAYVVIGDFLKGVLACLIGRWVFGEINPGDGIFIGEYMAGFFAVVGHNWPVYFGFKGGKGVMTSFAVALMFSPMAALICLVVFIIIVAMTRYVSLGSMVSAAIFPAAALLFNEPLYMVLTGAALAVLIIWRHRANIGRLVSGNESKLSFKTNKEK
jgi:glycerol-3-phosphate acyltransferase PlsY